MKGFLICLILLIPVCAYSECKVVEFEDKQEVVCSGAPLTETEEDQRYKEWELKEKQERGEEKKRFFADCRAEIEPRLKAPATAQYTVVPSRRDYTGKVITLAVDAQNGYGALIRSHYVCHFDSAGNMNSFESESR